jgi:hypothetical protein
MRRLDRRLIGHAEGSFQIYPEPKNCPQKRRARRGVPYHPPVVA